MARMVRIPRIGKIEGLEKMGGWSLLTGEKDKVIGLNIAIIANAVQCHT